MYESLLIGPCLQMLGSFLAMNTYAMPIICDPTPVDMCGTTALFEPPIQSDGPLDLCFMWVLPDDPYYDQYWCQPVDVDGVVVSTPCKTEVVSLENAPYQVRNAVAHKVCTPVFVMWGLCTPENVCTPADELEGLCTVDP